MRDGEKTREHILERAAVLFNQQGFAGASMSDVMAATGLQKGGIYRHFGSKEQLALEAFDFAVARMADRFREALEGKENAIERLGAIVGVYAELPVNPPVSGGCPVMNTAIDSDSAHPALRDVVSVCSVLLDGRAVPRDTEVGPDTVLEVLPPFAGG